MEFGSDASPPNQFRYTFEDKLEEANDKRQAREPNLENGVWKGPTPAKSVSIHL